MEKKYLAKIIAKDNQGLKLISAFCSGSKIKISNLKYLKKNQIFLCFLERYESWQHFVRIIYSQCFAIC